MTEFMSPEELADWVLGKHVKVTAKEIKKRDNAIRQAEHAKAQGLVEALQRISTQSWGTPEKWYRDYADTALDKFNAQGT